VARRVAKSRKTATGPRSFDVSRCAACGKCLEVCAPHRALGAAGGTPPERVRGILRVAAGEPAGDEYKRLLGLCLDCRACEAVCPEGLRFGRLLEPARAELEAQVVRGWWARRWRRFVYGYLLESRAALTVAGSLLYLCDASGLKRALRTVGSFRLLGWLGQVAQLVPAAEPPFFFSQFGRVFPAHEERRYRVAFLAGCVASVWFARLNEATVRVLQRQGCEVTVPDGQGCCGAIHLRQGMREDARRLARRNIDAFLKSGYDAIITNSGGCGAALKDYGDLLADDPAYAARARQFSALVRDVSEFLAGVECDPRLASIDQVAVYYDSCQMLNAQKLGTHPREMLAGIPGLELREIEGRGSCCGGGGIYAAIHTSEALRILEDKMKVVNASGARIIVVGDPSCALQMEAGVRLHGSGQRVLHVMQLLDLAYRQYERDIGC
jgi:glycolate oxidase iron-sulfur subunit